jgi:hypothetical protein
MDSLPTDCNAVVFQFLTLADLLSVRACSRALRERHAPGTSRRIWLLVAPTARVLVAHLPTMSLASVQLMSIVYEFSAAEVRSQGMLSTLCGRDCLAMSQWLASRFNLTAADAHATNNAALRYACVNGRLTTAQWLADHFGLTAEDARDGSNWPLRYACIYGHLSTAQWLVAHFKLTRTDALDCAGFALNWARKNGHAEVAQWLVDRFGPTGEGTK